MQFIRQKQQQVTTCPQCDNIVRVDAEVCNICGKRLREPNGKGRASSTQLSPISQASQHPPGAQSPQTPLPATQQRIDEEEYEEEEYEEEEDEEEEEYEEEHERERQPRPLPSTPGEIIGVLERLQDQSVQIERYFPAELPGKEQKLAAWKKQLQRARACAEMLQRSQLQQVESQPILKLRYHLAEAGRALDFTREYTVKVIGHAGAGKSTLLAAMIGRDIFPRLAGGAVTGVRTRIRLCGDNEQEEL